MDHVFIHCGLGYIALHQCHETVASYQNGIIARADIEVDRAHTKAHKNIDHKPQPVVPHISRHVCE